ncbi:MAG: hypothetical protein ACO2ZD_00625 [Pseudomonadales bacterium]
MNNNVLQQMMGGNPGAQRIMEQYQQLQQAQEAIKKPSSRDHQSTVGDEAMKITMAASWPAWDQFFNMVQRELAEMPQNTEHERNLNAIFLTLSQIINRALAFVDEGNVLRARDNALQNNAAS